MLLKICGITTERELDLVAEGGADLVGLWHEVPGGRAELNTEQLERLAAAARATGTPEPVLVTFSGDAERLAGVLARTGVSCVQLHAYQLPGTVRRLKDLMPEARVLKVLHPRDRRCTDRRLIGAYEDAGVDAFLIDATSRDGQLGSTGISVPPSVVAAVTAELERPFLLAGGITARSRRPYAAVPDLPGMIGVDVDSGARDPDGALRIERIGALRRAWGEPEGGRGAPALP